MLDKVKVQGESQRSTTIWRTNDPVWNEVFTFLVPRHFDINNTMLVVDLFDEDKVLSNEFLGRVRVPLAKLANAEARGQMTGWFDLHTADDTAKTEGNIHFHAVFDHDHRLAQAEQTERFELHRKQVLHHVASTNFTRYLDEYESEAKDRQVSVHVCTWNVGNTPPADDLSAWLQPGHDIYVVGSQECKYDPRKPHSSCKDDWRASIMGQLGEKEYKLVYEENLWEMRLLIAVRHEIEPLVKNIHGHHEATGIAHVLGNKGGLVVSMLVRDTSLCFVNSHLAAHQGESKRRNHDVYEIIKEVRVGKPNMDILHQFAHVVWMGDLNYRLDYGDQGTAESPSAEQHAEMLALIADGQRAKLFATDQLRAEMAAERVFVGFEEGDPSKFDPTFKMIKNELNGYNKKRSPAWCDRIVRRSMPGFHIEQTAYNSAPTVCSSDHKPVYATFKVHTAEPVLGVDDSLGDAFLTVQSMKLRPIVKDGASPEALPQCRVVFYSSILRDQVPSEPRKGEEAPSWGKKDVPVMKLDINNTERLRKSFVMLQVYKTAGASADDLLGNGLLMVDEWVENQEQFHSSTVRLSRGGIPVAHLDLSMKLHWIDGLAEFEQPPPVDPRQLFMFESAKSNSAYQIGPSSWTPPEADEQA
eukprot:TRINITY_DN65818_c10_g8_i2.p1 TRINITY_DN65818_c10_g8~~TRINITY_DN65818_c10_g8_i2.p1  ORF type:complete len:641 (-),score=352.78 TRINITY_DN65818_c10_g8_i2:101-2023(-)